MTHLELINPSPETQAAVTAAIQACRDWVPSVVQNTPRPPPPAPGIPWSLDAATMCSFVQDPERQAITGIFFGSIATLAMVGIIVASGLHRVPRLVFLLCRRGLQSWL